MEVGRSFDSSEDCPSFDFLCDTNKLTIKLMNFKHYKPAGLHQSRDGKSGTVTSRINISHDCQLDRKRTPLKEIIERSDFSNLSASIVKNSTASTLSRMLCLEAHPKSSKDLLSTIKTKTLIHERQPSLKHLKTDAS